MNNSLIFLIDLHLFKQKIRMKMSGAGGIKIRGRKKEMQWHVMINSLLTSDFYQELTKRKSMMKLI